MRQKTFNLSKATDCSWDLGLLQLLCFTWPCSKSNVVGDLQSAWIIPKLVLKALDAYRREILLLRAIKLFKI